MLSPIDVLDDKKMGKVISFGDKGKVSRTEEKGSDNKKNFFGEPPKNKHATSNHGLLDPESFQSVRNC